MKLLQLFVSFLNFIYVYGALDFNGTELNQNITKESIASVIETLVKYHKIIR